MLTSIFHVAYDRSLRPGYGHILTDIHHSRTLMNRNFERTVTSLGMQNGPLDIASEPRKVHSSFCSPLTTLRLNNIPLVLSVARKIPFDEPQLHPVRIRRQPDDNLGPFATSFRTRCMCSVLYCSDVRFFFVLWVV
jgi:hypothetical protein